MKTGTNNRRCTALSRREFLRLTGAGGGTILLAACGAQGGTGATGSAAPAGASGAASAAGASAAASAAGATEKTLVSFWTPGGSETFCQGFETIASNFEALNPDIDIGETQCGTGEQSFDEVLLARIAAGNPPDATVLWTSPIGLAARGSLEPLDELMTSSEYSQIQNWPEGVLASCQYGGKTYGLPATAGAYSLFYNQELFELKGIPTERESFPKTWDELRALSKEFTVYNGDTLESVGFVPVLEPGSEGVHFAYWTALNGGKVYDSTNQTYTIDAPQNIELMEYLLSWLDEEYKGDYAKLLQSGVFFGYTDAQGRPPMFQSGKQAILVQGFWFTGDFYSAIEPVFTEWNVAQLPVGPSGSGTVSGYWPNWLVIPKGVKVKEAAFKYLDYMTVEGIKVWFNNIPDLPTNKLVEDLKPGVVVEKRGDEFADEMMEFFRGQLEIATPMWDSPVQNFADDQITAAVEKIMNKAAPPKDALGEAQRACQAELEKTLGGS